MKKLAIVLLLGACGPVSTGDPAVDAQVNATKNAVLCLPKGLYVGELLGQVTYTAEQKLAIDFARITQCPPEQLVAMGYAGVGLSEPTVEVPEIELVPDAGTDTLETD